MVPLSVLTQARNPGITLVPFPSIYCIAQSYPLSIPPPLKALQILTISFLSTLITLAQEAIIPKLDTTAVVP